MSGGGSTYQTCLASVGSDSNDLLECIAGALDTSINTAAENVTNSVNTFFLIFAATLVFFMQTGFAMICAGCVRINNVQNTLLKNLLDACGASIGFYTVGYAFAFGGTSSQTTFIGNTNFFLMDVENKAFWLFQFAFAATSATIVAGTLAERCQMTAYLCYSVALSAFVYPVVVHSVWSNSGFLSASNANPLLGIGMIDFAGSCVVHVTGGMTALIATNILGPRTGRFHDIRGNLLEKPKPMPGHSVALQMLGTFILWVGWYGFNTGSVVYLMQNDNYEVVSHVAINTTLAAASGAVMALLIDTIVQEHNTGEVTFNLSYAMNGCLAGLVSITAGCAVVQSWAALIIGAIGAALFLGTSKLLVKRCVDDAVDAVPVHLSSGIWGSLSVGFLADPTWVSKVYGNSNHAGWFYSWSRGSADARLLACQVIGILFVVGWVTVTMTPFFWLLHYFGFLRADSLEEVVGLDVGYTGGALHKRLHGKDSDEDKDYSAYLDEYVHRRKERAFLKNASGHIPASSVHSPSLHGHSYHGRRVITPAMKEAAMGSSSDRGSALSNSSGHVKAPGSDREDWTDNEKAVMDSSRNSGVPSLSSVKEENV
ncbi:hypothetical protein ACHAWT_008436 [Skeletonema menzelii]|mmetsp:Transcript_17532/g.28688  ORF Transcript_17532/g.28688 Transcript_17532/m.28688 type:complete len:597 (+) Transcript_17532:206-1996(+)